MKKWQSHILNIIINFVFLYIFAITAFYIWGLDLSSIKFLDFLAGWILLATGIKYSNIEYFKGN